MNRVFSPAVLFLSLSVVACGEERPDTVLIDSDTTGFPQDPVERYRTAATRALTVVDRDNEITAYLRGLSPPDIAAQSQQLTTEGVGYLGEVELVTRYTLFAKAIENANTATCAALGRRTLPGEAYATLIGSLPARDVLKWAELTVTGMLRAVRGRKRGNHIPSQSTEDAAGIVRSSLTGEDQARFDAVLNDLSSVSDEDACWFQKKIYATAATLEGANGAVLRSGLASAEASESLRDPRPR